VDCDPASALAPVHAPDPVQAVALADDQFRVELLPLATEAGLAVRFKVGAGAVTATVADCAALPTTPLQVRV
jgi:hypothetical protein